jgi:glyoxylase I family protein
VLIAPVHCGNTSARECSSTGTAVGVAAFGQVDVGMGPDMSIEHVLAVIPVSDLAVSAAWYERMFDKEPTNRPMPNLSEWRLTDTGWVQVFVDVERAGRTFFNLAVSDLDGHLDSLRDRGLAPGVIQEATKGVRISMIEDPDGNVVNFIGGFRVEY